MSFSKQTTSRRIFQNTVAGLNHGIWSIMKDQQVFKKPRAPKKASGPRGHRDKNELNESETKAREQLRNDADNHVATQRLILMQNKHRLMLDALSPLDRMQTIQREFDLFGTPMQGTTEHLVLPGRDRLAPRTTKELLQRVTVHAVILGVYAFLLFYTTLSTSLPGGNAGKLSVSVLHQASLRNSSLPSHSILPPQNLNFWTSVANSFLTAITPKRIVQGYVQSSLAWKLNFFSGVCASLNTVILFLITCLWDISWSKYPFVGIEENDQPQKSFVLSALYSWRPWAALLACGAYCLSFLVWTQSTQLGPASFQMVTTSLLVFLLVIAQIELKQHGSQPVTTHSKWAKIISWVSSNFFLSLVCLCGAYALIGVKIADQELSGIFFFPVVIWTVFMCFEKNIGVKGILYISLACGISFAFGLNLPSIISKLTNQSVFQSLAIPERVMCNVSEGWIKTHLAQRNLIVLFKNRFVLYCTTLIKGWWWTLPAIIGCFEMRWNIPLIFVVAEALAVVVQPVLLPDHFVSTLYYPPPLVLTSLTPETVLPSFPLSPLVLSVCLPHLIWRLLQKITPGARFEFRQFLFGAIALSIIAFQLYYSNIGAVHNRTTESSSSMVYGSLILDSLPNDSIVLLNDTLAENVLLYLQQTEGQRTDLTLINLRGVSFMSRNSTKSPGVIFSESDTSVATFAKLNIQRYPIIYCGGGENSSLLQLSNSEFVAYPYGLCFQIFQKSKKPEPGMWIKKCETEDFFPTKQKFSESFWEYDPNAQWDNAVADAFWLAKHHFAHFVLTYAMERSNEKEKYKSALELCAKIYHEIVSHYSKSGRHVWLNLAITYDHLRVFASGEVNNQIVRDMLHAYKKFLSLDSPSSPEYNSVTAIVKQWETYLSKKK